MRKNKHQLSKMILATKSPQKYLRLKEQFDKIEKELESCYKERRNKSEYEAISKIKRNPRNFYSYAKKFQKVQSNL